MRLLAPFAFLIALLLVAVSAESPRPRADVVVAQRSDAFTLDAQRISWMHDIRLARSLYEPLVRIDPSTGKPAPGVAESWTLSDDRRTYTFTLRPNARWSNGDPVVAGDFAYAWKRALLPDTAADYSGFLFEVDGAREFFAWRNEALAAYAKRPASERTPAAAKALWEETERRFRDTVGIEATDPHTLEVRLARPVPYFLDLVAFPALSPAHAPTIERFASLDPASGRRLEAQGWTKPGTIVTNGPLRIVSWRYKRDMRLEPNEHYWDRASVKPKSVDILILEDANTTMLAAESGAIDWVTEILADYRAEMLAERERYESHHRAALDAMLAAGTPIDEALAKLPPPGPGERRNVHALDAFGTDFYSFNCRPTLESGEPNPFADPRVRRAFCLATDRATLVERVTRLGEDPSTTLVPPKAFPGYKSPKGLPYDPARAKRELAEAGWSDRDGDGLVEDADGKPFPTVQLLYSTGGSRYRDLSIALQQMWKEKLGVEIVARGKDSKDFSSDLKSGNFMIARGTWYGDYYDPTTWLELSRSSDGNNDRKYASPTYDAMLDAAAAEPDPARRLDLLAEAERFLLEEEPPMVPLCTMVSVYGYDPTVLHGLTHQQRLDQQLHRLWTTG